MIACYQSKFLRKLFILIIALSVFFTAAIGFLSIRSGYGIDYVPKIYKGLVKDLLFRAYGPKTFPAYKFFDLYTRMAIKSLLTNETESYQEHMLGYDISYFDRVSFFSGYAEIFVKEIYHFTADNDTPFIIDCGSNTGVTILYFKMLYPKAEVIGFEPSGKCFELIKKNIADNHLENVTVHNKAVSDKKGVANFWDPSMGKGDGRASILVDGQSQHMTTVESVVLSDYITKPVDLLKMDIEGSEFIVFQELAASGKLPLIKEIVLEYHHHIPNSEIDRMGKFLALLEDHNFGYQIRGCNVGIGYQFDPKEVQLLNIHVYNKAFNKGKV